MRRMLVGVVAALFTIAVAPVAASAGAGGDGSPSHLGLFNHFQRELIAMTESDQWLFTDGCIGGANKHDPLNIVVPSTDPATTESACSVKKGAPIVISSAAFTCWEPTLKLARSECLEGWNDPAQKLLHDSVTVDGKAKRLTPYRVSGCLTFPEGAVLDTPGVVTQYFAIGRGVVVTGLKPGVHTIFVSFEYADGFAGATTFTITVTN